MIRVLLADDSIVQREILRRILAADGAFTIVAERGTGARRCGWSRSTGRTWC